MLHLFYSTKIENAVKGQNSAFPSNLASFPWFNRKCRLLKAAWGRASRRAPRIKRTRTRRAALRHAFRPSRCGSPEPANMAAAYFLCRSAASLAVLLLLSFRSLAASQLEVGVGLFWWVGPRRTAVLWPWARSRCPIHSRLTGASWNLKPHQRERVGRVSLEPDRTV